ncbi:MAG TPA: prolyl oligopeptidase family serine peptidase [Membranihabitans sp.]|nr:prolyl oligopeptidase family serine peptidase [Membranihabitans sp.]
MNIRQVVFIAVIFISMCHIPLVAQEINKLLYYKDIQGQDVPVRSLYDWELKKAQILDSAQALFGPLPEIPTLPPYRDYDFTFPPFDVQVMDSLVRDHHTRYNIQFTVAENETVLAYLYIPHEKPERGKFPAMLALPPTTGRVLVDGRVPYGRELADRGYVVIATEYPGIGELKDYDFESDRYESGIMKGIFNHIRCVDFLRTMKGVDAERIGAIGHSLGGHSAIFLGIFDTRIKVVVTSVGWTQIEYYNIGERDSPLQKGRLWPWAQDRYAPLYRTKYNSQPGNFPFNFDELIAALAPRYFYSNSPIHDSNFNVEGVRKGIASASEAYRMYNAEDHIQVRYPVAGHDFPDSVREDAYKFIDKALKY